MTMTSPTYAESWQNIVNAASRDHNVIVEIDAGTFTFTPAEAAEIYHDLAPGEAFTATIERATS